MIRVALPPSGAGTTQLTPAGTHPAALWAQAADLSVTSLAAAVIWHFISPMARQTVR